MKPVLLTAHNPGPMTGSGNNTYLIIGSGRATLIDAGVGHQRHLRELNDRLLADAATLERVLVTHFHADHASGAPAIAAAHASAVFEKFPWPEEDARYDVAWRPLADGDVVVAGGEPIVALHTPGHSPDHMAFWHDASRSVFSGDLVSRDTSVMIHTSRGGNLAAYLASLVDTRADLELAAPVALNVVCFRYVPPGRAPEDLDRLNHDLLIRLQTSGIALPSHTVLNGRFVIRAAITNHRSVYSDFDVLVDAVARFGAEANDSMSADLEASRI